VDYDEDDVFDIMGNAVRRKILMYLAQRPRSINELNEAIDVSRQAILKHLKDLEHRGFIEAREVEKQGKTPGPSPHMYELKQSFVIRFDLNPAAINPRIITLQLGFQTTSPEELEGLPVRPHLGSIKEAISQLSTFNKQLEKISNAYQEIHSKKQGLLHVLKRDVEIYIPGEEEREVLELLINNPEKAMLGFELQEISSEFEIRGDFMKFILDNLIAAGVVKHEQDGKYYLQ
jgi:predicted transcriptional regulator